MTRRVSLLFFISLFSAAQVFAQWIPEERERIIKYAGPLTPLDLPVDAHELVALCAPRPVFISVGSPDVEGQWIDAKGMFLAAVHASPVYELLGKRGLSISTLPPQETAIVDGEIAFRQHGGGHTVGPNWPVFISFAERYLSK